MSPESTLEQPRAAPGVQPSSPRSPLSTRLRRVPGWLLSPPGLATLVAALFIAISVAWVLYDERVPLWDQGRHLSNIFFLREQVLGGDLFAWWHHYTMYPPLVYLIGIGGTLVGGVNAKAPVIAFNAVGVPLLVVACYRVASIAFDRRAGILAVLLALASPMVIGLFHDPILDATQTAFVAGSIWLLFETERFSRPGMSILAGLLAGAALLAKQSSAFFIAPLVAVMLVRGGLRDWRKAVQDQAALPLFRTPLCAFLFAGIALLIALPWYLDHGENLRLAGEAVRGGPEVVGADRLSIGHLAPYLWMLINNHLFVPLSVLFAIGLGHATVSWLRTRSPTDYRPELIIGLFGSTLLTALWFSFHDPRYTLPAIVYVAALAGGWVVSVGRTVRLAAVAALVGVFIVNTSALNLGVPGPARISTGIADDRAIREGLPTEFVVLSNFGHFVGPPQKGGDVRELLRVAAEDGVTTVGYEENLHLTREGMTAIGAELSPLWIMPPDPPSTWPMLWKYSGSQYNPVLLGDRGIYLVHRSYSPGEGSRLPRRLSAGARTRWPQPCRQMTVEDGLREDGVLYVFRGAPGAIDGSGRLIRPRVDNLYCPGP